LFFLNVIVKVPFLLARLALPMNGLRRNDDSKKLQKARIQNKKITQRGY
jgi:hypothetical protein